MEAREEAAVLAKNEQLRANLLRSISHDLRTPLTSISGNADVLLDQGSTGTAVLDAQTRRGLLLSILPRMRMAQRYRREPARHHQARGRRPASVDYARAHG